ncbi:MAG: peroxiredoxin [Alphaproteobacteria bacterium]|nr:peroxiredoxin [Alphaproteobacteria bacterium]
MTQQSVCTHLPLIGENAPEFYASTTSGKIHFPNDFTGQWVVLFSHPSDFTPVCTTEFIEFQKHIKEFEKLNTQLIGLSVGTLASHLAWFNAIENMPEKIKITFPLIDDLNTSIAQKYGMIHLNASNTNTVRAVFVIDPDGIIRAILYYPPTLGRNIPEILRILTALQTADAFKVATGANWNIGDDVIIPSPQTIKDMRKKASDDTSWFLKYKKLNKSDIYEKIGKKATRKK